MLKVSCGAVFCFLPCSAAASAAGGKHKLGWGHGPRIKNTNNGPFDWGSAFPQLVRWVSVAPWADSWTAAHLSFAVMGHHCFQSGQRKSAGPLTLTSASTVAALRCDSESHKSVWRIYSTILDTAPFAWFWQQHCGAHASASSSDAAPVGAHERKDSKDWSLKCFQKNNSILEMLGSLVRTTDLYSRLATVSL